MTHTATRSSGSALVPAFAAVVMVVAAIVGILVIAAPTVTGVVRGNQWLDGALPSSVTVFDNAYPGVARLNPRLLQTLRNAATDAARDGVEIYINSGWRSRSYQAQLLSEAVSQYGSEEEAARWVATADTSPHVSGEAADVGPSDAATWLSQHGADYGLCQIYRNEPWHYELRPEAAKHGCPRVYSDPTQDPRMQH